MGLRPGRCYRKIHRPYTRVAIRVPRKSYIKGVPRPKISGWEAGTPGNYTHVLFLKAKRAVQIRHNALESARVGTVRTLEKAGVPFFFKLRIYPHHVLRENPLATGAGADRFQTGMRMSFGNPIGTAAQVRPNQIIAEVRVNEKDIKAAKAALKQATFKLPTPCTIAIERL